MTLTKRLAAVASLAIVCLLTSAGPALAQRDPFHPVIDPAAATTTTTTGTTTGGPIGTPEGPTDIGSDGLANTGTDLSPWLALAYGLFVVGGGALLISRMYQPLPVRRR